MIGGNPPRIHFTCVTLCAFTLKSQAHEQMVEFLPFNDMSSELLEQILSHGADSIKNDTNCKPYVLYSGLLRSSTADFTISRPAKIDGQRRNHLKVPITRHE